MTSARSSWPRSSRAACTAAIPRSSRSPSWLRRSVARPVLLLGAGGAGELSARLWHAAQSGDPVAVLDPAWPTELRAAAERAVRDADLPAESLVFFTSGSSGRPRGVVRSVQSWLASVDPLSEVSGIDSGDHVWLPGSATSTLTLYGGWHAFAVGADVSGQSGWPGAAPPEGITALHAAPRMFEAVLREGERGRLPHLDVAVVAGGFLPAASRERAASLGWRVIEYYGAAELSFVAWRPDSSAYQRFPDVEIELREGEIWVSSPYLGERYLEPDDDGPLRRDGEWATVGDLGRLDRAGLEVLGRGDAAVTTGGRTVVVEEVERAIRDSPALTGQLADVVVTGIPHPLLGELLVALVAVGEAPSALTRADLDAACAGLPEWSAPRRWWLVPDLPRTAAGKADRAAVRAGIADGRLTPRPLR